MAMTIKQLADTLEVSKTAIRNHMDEEFRAKYTEKDSKGVIGITSEGCKVIAVKLERTEKIVKTPESNFAERSANTENIVIPRMVWEVLQKELEEKNRQLEAKDKQIADLTESVKAQAQSINADRHNELAGTMQQMLPGGETVAEEEKKRTGFFGWVRRK